MAAEERGEKERIATAENAAVAADAGFEVAEATEEGEIGGEGSQADEEEEADGSEREERKSVFERMGARMLVPAGSRGSWRGRGGKGRGGFHPRPWYGAATPLASVLLLDLV